MTLYQSLLLERLKRDLAIEHWQGNVDKNGNAIVHIWNIPVTIPYNTDTK